MNSENNKTFQEFNLSKELQNAIKRLGYEVPTEIQAESIPPILEGKDVVGESATGSGKTLAFGCGAIETITPKKGLQVLILLPTRELAEQVTKSIKELDPKKQFKVLPVYGGVSINPQMDALRYSEIVVATPGRLKDHIQRGTIDLSRIKLLVLDEADRMLDMGFIEDIEDIVKRCPKQRQTLFFSATFPPQVRALTKKYLINPISVKVRNQVDPKLLKQIYYDVKKHQKLSLLIHLIKNEKAESIMIFCNTRRTVDLILDNLKKNSIKASALHGGHTQSNRTKVIQRFKEGKDKILLCTDVAARGIHVDNVSHVYNYEIPSDSNDYVHRIGRTARAGSDGLVINLVCDLDHDNFSKIFRDFDFEIKKVQTPQVENVRMVIPQRQGRNNSRGGARGGTQGRNQTFGNKNRGRESRSDQRPRNNQRRSRPRRY